MTPRARSPPPSRVGAARARGRPLGTARLPGPRSEGSPPYLPGARRSSAARSGSRTCAGAARPAPARSAAGTRSSAPQLDPRAAAAGGGAGAGAGLGEGARRPRGTKPGRPDPGAEVSALPRRPGPAPGGWHRPGAEQCGRARPGAKSPRAAGPAPRPSPCRCPGPGETLGAGESPPRPGPPRRHRSPEPPALARGP